MYLVVKMDESKDLLVGNKEIMKYAKIGDWRTLKYLVDCEGFPRGKRGPHAISSKEEIEAWHRRRIVQE